MSNDAKLETICIKIPLSLLKKIDKIAYSENSNFTCRSELIRFAIVKYLDELQKIGALNE